MLRIGPDLHDSACFRQLSARAITDPTGLRFQQYIGYAILIKAGTIRLPVRESHGVPIAGAGATLEFSVDRHVLPTTCRSVRRLLSTILCLASTSPTSHRFASLFRLTFSSGGRTRWTRPILGRHISPAVTSTRLQQPLWGSPPSCPTILGLHKASCSPSLQPRIWPLVQCRPNGRLYSLQNHCHVSWACQSGFLLHSVRAQA